MACYARRKTVRYYRQQQDHAFVDYTVHSPTPQFSYFLNSIVKRSDRIAREPGPTAKRSLLHVLSRT